MNYVPYNPADILSPNPQDFFEDGDFKAVTEMKCNNKDGTLIWWVWALLSSQQTSEAGTQEANMDNKNASREIKPADLFTLGSILQNTTITNFCCLSYLIFAISS